jgi:hypothetical protein
MKIVDLYFVEELLWQIAIYDAYDAIVKCDLFDFIKNNEIETFAYFRHEDAKIMSSFHKMSELADVNVGHSGASFGCTMRTVEQIIKYGFDKWKISYITQYRPDILEHVKTIQKRFRICVSNPEYKMCKSRLTREYFDLVI